MKLDVRTALILHHPIQKAVLLLRRSPTKRLFPNLITGIGGKVEVTDGEDSDLVGALWREFEEETEIPRESVEDARLRLSTLLSRDDEQVLLLWFTGKLKTVPADLTCTEGELEFFDVYQLPLAQMIPTARATIPFILSLPDDDLTIYNGCFDFDNQLITNKKG